MGWKPADITMLVQLLLPLILALIEALKKDPNSKETKKQIAKLERLSKELGKVERA